jgi:hypothetical protein
MDAEIDAKINAESNRLPNRRFVISITFVW